MKPNLMVFTAICTAILMLTPVASATDTPPMPERFYGTVTANGAAAPDGTIISVWIDNTELISQATMGGKYGYVPPASEEFNIYGSEGATIVFKINGVEAGTDILSSSDITQKDLSATGVVISTPTPAPGASDPADTSGTSNPSGGGGSASLDATPKPPPTVAMTEGDVQLAPPTSAAPPGESGEAAKDPETIPTTNQGGTKPSSSIPGFAGVTAIFMLLAVIYGLRRNG